MIELSITPLQTADEARECAQMMASSEPWITLGRDFEASLAVVSHPDRETYLARAGDALAGFIIINMTGAFVGYIQTICVAPEFRSRGVGTQLIAFAESRIFRDAPNVFMCVSSFNDGARRLYERLGYQVVGELTDYLVRGHSEILLRKTRGPILG
ncbi:MAG TPA: GNAT family N-acetyltransferase [Thermoanaerobaculia bacterium]|nr:GNAT family N-acetyltransferase [Thermoanaerobaculia bacterium]